jgi:hypothetical protein
MRRLIAVGLAAVVPLAAGCGQSQAPAKHKPSAKSFALPSSGWNGTGAALAGQTVGVLEGAAKSACVWLTAPPLPRRVPRRLRRESGRGAVLWPDKYRARFDPVELLDGSGHVVARAGDIIQFGGGITSVSPTRRCMFGERNAAVVQSHIFVTGQKSSQR